MHRLLTRRSRGGTKGTRKMREILFRAKDKNTHEWVYGCYVRMLSAAGFVYAILVPAENPDESNTIYPIIPGTVGEYTGLTDKNGKKIFEGDIVRYNDTLHKVVFCTINGCAFFGITYPDRGEVWNFDGITCAHKMKIIGNIHDDPEVVDGDEK